MNCKLDKQEVLEQLAYFKVMGLGGATIHCRTGLDTEYMGEEFMDIVSDCVEKAKKMEMKICLYNEDRWPSGSAGGKVTIDHQYRGRYLLFTQKKSTDKTPLGIYRVVLEQGYLAEYARLEEEQNSGTLWYAYLNILEDDPWHNNQSYVNTLEQQAIKRFIELTHEPYYQLLGDDFGDAVPSIFTDEPQFTRKQCLGKASDGNDLMIPYTDDFEESYQTIYGASFLEHLPELFWELPEGKASLTRYRYHDHLAERFASAFSDTLGKWCVEHGIKLTGHMMQEPTLESQTGSLGETMRHYRGFEIPGIDMLCDWREYTTAKQAQSAAHQMGSSKVLSELYGVTNWDFDFRGHKLQGDWQAALGVTERVHHLSWMSMAGEAKRDYPASIFYQAPWFEKYHLIEDYFSRVNTALQSGKPSIKIGVIHPIESYWLAFGPLEQTAMVRSKLEKQFEDVTEWLLFGLLDFNYISESLMMDLEARENTVHQFTVGKMGYDVVVVPGCITLRETTLQKLKEFSSSGGKIIFMGDFPTHVGGEASDEIRLFAERCTCIGFDEIALHRELEQNRQIDVRDSDGVRSTHFVSQTREVEDGAILFLANGKKAKNLDVTICENYTVSVRGQYYVTLLDAASGKKMRMQETWNNNRTSVQKTMYEEDSLLLLLSAEEPIGLERYEENERYATVQDLTSVASYRLSEPNVLVLDQARYALDDQPFRPSEEVLRIDNTVRGELGLHLKMDALEQPWVVDVKENAGHTMTLEYVIYSTLELPEATLAVEGLEQLTITCNGVKQDGIATGYFTDKAIETTLLQNLHKGENRLVIQMPYTSKTNLEWMYLLGDFGVELFGNRARLVEKPETIGFCDLALQRHPFYAGNITYAIDLNVEKGQYSIQVPKYRAHLVEILLDGKTLGQIMYSPYLLDLGELQGQHKLEITAYGNRHNAFGPIHLSDEKEEWIGPNAWRSEGERFSYEYQLKRFGLLSAPRLYRHS